MEPCALCQAYQALRGVSLIVATTVVSEIGDMIASKTRNN